MMRHLVMTAAAVLAGGQAARACFACNPDLAQRQSLAHDARQAKCVVYGTLANPRLNGDQGGATDVVIEAVVKADPALAGRRTVTINRYIPVDPKTPARFLVFCDVNQGRVDVYRGVPIKATAVVDYLKASLAIPDQQRGQQLLYHFRHLDAPDAEVAADAFLELAKATDQEIAAVARYLKPDKLRSLLSDPKTPPERLGVLAFLLGSCGTRSDGDLLSAMLAKGGERVELALGGLLGGLIELRPEEGWALAMRLLRDGKKSFAQRLAVLGTLRFYHTWRPVETRADVLRGLAILVEDGDMADMAIEDLRRWKWWDLTRQVLGQYGKQSHSAPLVRRAIIRYALCCPDPVAADFLRARRAEDAAAVQEVEEGLEFEKPAAPVTRQDR